MSSENIPKLSFSSKINITSNQTGPIAEARHGANCYVDQLLRSGLYKSTHNAWASQVAPEVKKPPANVGDLRDMGSNPGCGRSPGGGHGNPPQYSCLENAMDSRSWWATVHRAAQSQT